jgi:magnesium-transporting ATPase (P-type)
MSGTTVTPNATAPKPNATPAPKPTNAESTINYGSWLTIGFFGLSIALFITAIVIMSLFLADENQYKSIKEKLPQIFLPAIFGSIALFIASYFYFKSRTDNPSVIYYILGLVCLAVCASFSALALSVLKKSS